MREEEGESDAVSVEDTPVGVGRIERHPQSFLRRGNITEGFRHLVQIEKMAELEDKL